MKQQTLAVAADQNAQYEQYCRPTKRDIPLATMEQIVPSAALCEVIEPYYPKPSNGRPPVGLERMLRMYLVQHWFNLADAACEDALLDSTALRRIVGIDLGRERVPDATTLLRFLRPTYHFGMKLHIGVDSQSGLAHSVVVTAANVHDKHPLPDLLHGQEQVVFGDCAYASQQELIRGKGGCLDFCVQGSV